MIWGAHPYFWFNTHVYQPIRSFSASRSTFKGLPAACFASWKRPATSCQDAANRKRCLKLGNFFGRKHNENMSPLLWEYKQSNMVNMWTVKFGLLQKDPKGSLMQSHEEFDCSDQWYCRWSLTSPIPIWSEDGPKQIQRSGLKNPKKCPIHFRIITTSQLRSFEGVSSKSFSTSNVTWQLPLDSWF